MFISEHEYLLAGTDDGYVSAKRVDGVWSISLPPHAANSPRFANAETRFADTIALLNADSIPVEIAQVHGNLQNLASGAPLARRRARINYEVAE